MNSGQFDDHSTHQSRDQLDFKLVSRIQKGDKEAFDLLLVKYQNRVASIVSRYIDDSDEIADATQEIFLRVYRSIHSFRGESSFYTWLFRIAINFAKSYVHKNKVQKRQSGVHEPTSYENDAPTMSHFDSPDNILSRSELAVGLENALKVMPAELSVALILREFDGLSYNEISKIMECPIGTVRSRIFRARELLDNTIKSLSEVSYGS